jgi:transcription-repair coupling factor (superfamily II helicase)
VEKSAELLERVATSKPIARKLEAIQRAQWPVRFSHVIQTGQPFLGAVLANAHHGRQTDKRQATDSTIWVLCPSVHSQEVFYESLLNWQPDALFLPEAELTGIENVLPDPEITAERLALFLQIERGSGPRIIVATRAGLDQAAPKRGSLESAIVQLRRGTTAKMEEFFERLAASGYERVSQVTTRGQFAVRGGIVDLYSWQAPLPFRLEFFGDQIESLREFDIDTQTSLRDLRSIDILLDRQGAAVSSPPGRSGDRPCLIEDQSGNVRDYVRERDLIIDVEPDGISNAHVQISEGWIETGPEDFSGAFQDCEIGEFGAGDLVLAEAKRAQFVERLKEWRANNDRIIIYFQTEGEIERFREIMEGTVEGVDFVEGSLARGFCFPAANLVVLSAAELFGRFAVHPRRLLRLRRAERHRAQIDFSELAEGDLVVHLEHGIGRFLGLEKIPRGTGFQPVGPAGVSPAESTVSLSNDPNKNGFPGLTATRQISIFAPSSRNASFTKSCSPTETPPLMMRT